MALDVHRTRSVVEKQKPADADAKHQLNELFEVLFKPRDRTRAKTIMLELEEKLPTRRIKLTNRLFDLIDPGITESEWTKLKTELGDNYRDPSWMLWMLGQTRLQAKRK